MLRLFPVTALAALVACGDVEDPDNDNEGEVITTVELTFAPTPDGPTSVFVWADPENDGDAVVDPIELVAGTTYDVSVRFLNELEEPPEDITVEVAAESDEHQIFLLGSAVEGPATGENADAVLTHTYADTDANGLPVGLEDVLVADGAGTGELVLVLRHLPEEGGAAQKVEGLAEDVAAGGLSSIGGDTDVEVTFPVTVL